MPPEILVENERTSKNKSLQRLVEEVRRLAGDPSVRKVVKLRVRDFKDLRNRNSRCWFKELVFCILTANSSAQTGLRCIKALEEKALVFCGSKDVVKRTLEEEGHRYARRRAEYIVLGRKWSKKLKEQILSIGDTLEAREWLVKEIKGIGWKEGSHFLRNVGFLDLAILDRHILSVMSGYCLITEEKKSLTRKRYLAYENILRKVGEELKMPLGELDLYLWYMKTGTILK